MELDKFLYSVPTKINNNYEMKDLIFLLNLFYLTASTNYLIRNKSKQIL